MKKFIFICVLFIMAAAFSGAQEMERYWQLYNTATTNTDQLGILEMLSRQNISGMGEFYVRALRRLVAGHANIRGATQINAADGQAMILSAAIGNEGPSAAAAASDLWLVVDRFRDPLVRAEALAALGKIEAREYLPHVIRVLNDANLPNPPDRLNTERVAYGAIISLENFADPAGFLPVYFASVGWYSDRIKNQAAKSLPLIAEDPYPFMKEILRSPGNTYRVKLSALQYSQASNTSVNNKAELAAIALEEAWNAYTSDISEKSTLRQSRMLSMNMISEHGAANDSVYPLLERCYKEGEDTTEKEEALSTIAALATEDSARLLSDFLMDLTDKLKSDRLTNEDQHLVRLIIPYLGSIKSREGFFALTAVLGSDWVPVVKNLAQDALRQIQ